MAYERINYGNVELCSPKQNALFVTQTYTHTHTATQNT